MKRPRMSAPRRFGAWPGPPSLSRRGKRRRRGVSSGSYPGQAPAKVPVQRHHVEDGLERVVRPAHLGFQGGRAVMPCRQVFPGGAEPIGLVVRHEVPLCPFLPPNLKTRSRLPVRYPRRLATSSGPASADGYPPEALLVAGACRSVAPLPTAAPHRSGHHRRRRGARTRARRAGRPARGREAAPRRPSRRGV